MPIIADYHLHTHNSGDSTAPMADMIESAIQKGLSEICFTEHMDMDYPTGYDLPDDPFILDVLSYKKELDEMKKRYEGRIKLKFGVEVGMQTQIAKQNADFVSSYNFDFVIASMHLVDRKDPYYKDMWEGKDSKDLIKRYFESTLENIELFDNYDVLGHLDYVTRYAPDADAVYRYELFSSYIDPILRHLAGRGKGLDLNSKMLGKDIKSSPNPCPEIISRFKELGGMVITFGSDAHKPAPIACGFDRMQQIAIDAGFREYFTFDKRNPIPHSL
ncbi:MAG: histidinol-phosphatase HisJ family protein [Butyrivibrio sp.]|nr:histidinol-phosphatase HisJ family protein [Butyrivibrio sp.]